MRATATLVFACCEKLIQTCPLPKHLPCTQRTADTPPQLSEWRGGWIKHITLPRPKQDSHWQFWVVIRPGQAKQKTKEMKETGIMGIEGHNCQWYYYNTVCIPNFEQVEDEKVDTMIDTSREQSEISFFHLNREVIKETVTIVRMRYPMGGDLPLCHSWALEVQLEELEVLAENWELQATIWAPKLTTSTGSFDITGNASLVVRMSYLWT
jgi:hypothetical protein